MAGPEPSEIELKLEARPEDLGRLKAHRLLAGLGPARTLVSTYYDTPDLKLRKAGLSLRVRSDGTRRVQTVKTGGDGGGLLKRGEWEAEVTGPAPDLAAAGGSPLGQVLNGDAEHLKAQFRIEAERAGRIVKQGGSEIELTLDEGRAVAGRRRTAILEIELELVKGEAADLFALARALLKTVPLRLSSRTKGEAGFALVTPTAEAVKAVDATLDRAMTTGEAFQTIARACLGQFLANERLVRDHRDVEAVHQARVALRRLRAARALFKPMLADAESERLNLALKDLADTLGAARDLDVLGERVAALRLEAPFDPAAVGRALKRRREDAYDAACAALNSAETGRLLFDVAAWLEAGAWRTSPASLDPVEAFAARTLNHRAKGLRKAARGLAGLDAATRHKVRIRAKKVRYGAEFFASLARGKAGRRAAKAFIAHLKPLQEALGDLNDLVNAERLLSELAHGEGDANLAFAAGAMVEEIERSQPRLLKKAGKAARGFAEAENFL